MGTRAHDAKPTMLAHEGKPMATAARVSLFSRRIEVSLSSAAIDILFDKAVILSEGNVEGDRYFGSTMITFDLTRAADLVSDACDAATLKRIGELLSDDPRVKDRARCLGGDEARRCSSDPLCAPQVDVRVTTTGTHLHLDLDVEAKVIRN